MSFDALGLSSKVLEAVTLSGFTIPTPIQAQAIPHVMARRDVLGLAQTGSGKTAAFVLPMLTLLEKGRARARMPRTLILEPTRELAAQVQEAFETLGKQHKLTVALLHRGHEVKSRSARIARLDAVNSAYPPQKPVVISNSASAIGEAARRKVGIVFGKVAPECDA